MADIELTGMTQGAVQLNVVLNNTSLTIGKKNLSSLQVTRNLGDVANKFTLEVFDETAYQLENELAGTGQCPITITYSAASNYESSGDLRKSITFSGVCTSYQISFVGRATMLSIEGILSAASTVDASISWWFKKATINWCNNDIEYDENQEEEIDGRPITIKGNDSFNPNDPRDIICAYETDKWVTDEDGNRNEEPYKEVVANPARIFRRIMETFKQVFGPDFFKYEVEECRWVSGLDCIQNDETVPEFITRALCPPAVTWYNKGTDNYNEQIAGFRYYCDENGHHFKRLNYNEATEADTITLRFGQRDSRVISFTASDVGALAMANNTTLFDEVLASNSAMDTLIGTSVTAGGENITNASGNIEVNLQSSGLVNTSSNYFGDLLKNNILNNNSLRSTKKISNSTYESLSATYSTDYNNLNDLPFQAQLTIWGEYSGTIKPGNFINLLTFDTNGHEHYTTGNYYITEVIDNVSSEGFIQTITMIKNTTSYKINGINADDTTGFTSNVENKNSGVISYTPGQQAFNTELSSNGIRSTANKNTSNSKVQNTTTPVKTVNPKLKDTIPGKVPSKTNK